MANLTIVEEREEVTLADFMRMIDYFRNDHRRWCREVEKAFTESVPERHSRLEHAREDSR